MRLSDDFQLLFRFGEGDVKAGLPLTEPRKEELQGDGGLPGAGVAFYEKEVTAWKTPIEDIVEARNSRGHTLFRLRCPTWRVTHLVSLCRALPSDLLRGLCASLRLHRRREETGVPMV
jgi:hypothetical protein